MEKILVIQTAFIGDVILSTALLEKLRQYYPNTKIDVLVRKGNESLFNNHPFINQIHAWDKKNGKYKSFIKTLTKIRSEEYDLVINLQRFMFSGLFTFLSKASYKIGFQKNPLSFLFNKMVDHKISKDGDLHEVERNQLLIAEITDQQALKPKLYPYKEAKDIHQTDHKYFCIAPTSVWFTKQFPIEKWISLINKMDPSKVVYLLGGPGDQEACNSIRHRSTHPNIVNKAGHLNLLDSAALMKGAVMNYVNDSAPMHLCSAVDAPVTAIYCSTVPAFGFGPLSSYSRIVESKQDLDCRPCNLHGFKKCPKGHFKCSQIEIEDILN